MIDLSGTMPAWPGEAVRLWGSCVGEASTLSHLWRFPAPRGDDLLCEQLGRLLGLDPSGLTITASVRAAALTYSRREQYITLERPTFPGVARALREARAHLALREWEDLVRGEDAMRPLLWVTSPFRNPDGATLTEDHRAVLAERLAAGQHVAINCAYLWYAPEIPAIPGADLIGSLHKLGGLGTRVGWVHSATYFQDAVPELLGTTPSPVWQHAWGLFLQRDGADYLRQGLVEPTLVSAAAFQGRLSERTGEPPRFAGPHGILPLAPGVSEQQALRQLENQAFRLCAGEDFFCTHPAVRASFLGVSAAAAECFADAVASCGLFALDPIRGDGHVISEER
jgi:DNA-binding transcriptional MocR family regulator